MMFILVLSAGSFKGIKYSKPHGRPITHLVPSSWNPFLKIANCREYLEAGLSGSMRNSILIRSDLFVSGPSIINLVHPLLNLTNESNGGGCEQKEEGKAAEDLENLLMAIIYIDLAQQKCD
jgi:hypothetical protein